MKRITTIAIAAFTAITIGATSLSTSAYAGDRERRIAAGVLLGAIGGAIIAGEIHRKKKRRHARRHYYNPQPAYRDEYRPRRHQFRERRVRHQPRLSRWERHVRRCYNNYRSYDERSDTFIGYDGRERRCRL